MSTLVCNNCSAPAPHPTAVGCWACGRSLQQGSGYQMPNPFNRGMGQFMGGANYLPMPANDGSGAQPTYVVLPPSLFSQGVQPNPTNQDSGAPPAAQLTSGTKILNWIGGSLAPQQPPPSDSKLSSEQETPHHGLQAFTYKPLDRHWKERAAGKTMTMVEYGSQSSLFVYYLSADPAIADHYPEIPKAKDLVAMMLAELDPQYMEHTFMPARRDYMRYVLLQIYELASIALPSLFDEKNEVEEHLQKLAQIWDDYCDQFEAKFVRLWVELCQCISRAYGDFCVEFKGYDYELIAGPWLKDYLGYLIHGPPGIRQNYMRAEDGILEINNSMDDALDFYRDSIENVISGSGRLFDEPFLYQPTWEADAHGPNKLPKMPRWTRLPAEKFMHLVENATVDLSFLEKKTGK